MLFRSTYKRYKIKLNSNCVRAVQSSTTPVIFGIVFTPPREVATSTSYSLQYLYSQSNLSAPFGPPPTGYTSWSNYFLYGSTNTPNSYSLRYVRQIILWNSITPYTGQEYYIDSMTYPILQDVPGASLVAQGCLVIEEVDTIGYGLCNPLPLDGFNYPDSAYRMVFNSPETSFAQPFLGDILKLETAMFGAGKAHFVEVKKNAMYKLLTKEAQEDALRSSGDIAGIGGFDATAMFTTYQAYLQIGRAHV